MQKLVASTPNAEVLGESILGYINCIEYEEIAPILQVYGFQDVQAQAWYPHQKMLDVLHDIESQKYNVSTTLTAIGIKIMELATVPESVNSVPAILESLGVVYHHHHRNITETGWSARVITANHIQVLHDSPYPEDLAYGIVWGSVRRFHPAKTQFTVTRVAGTEVNAPTYYEVTLSS